jgi:Helix-turn-helix domain
MADLLDGRARYNLACVRFLTLEIFEMSASILTIEELADYLKLSPEVTLNQSNQGKLPGRKIEDTWRFLKDAINDWLGSK